MQRSWVDVNSPINESAELTQGALKLFYYSEGAGYLGVFMCDSVDTRVLSVCKKTVKNK
jgi:hypothetical protein